VDSYLKRCSLVWLVIAAGGRHISANVELQRDVREHCYQTRFTRVIFYDRVSQTNEHRLR
jgi:hypothetical protein